MSERRIMKKIWKWIKQKWQIVVSTVVALYFLLRMMLNARRQKGILENANKAHEAEKKANAKAEKALLDGLSRINEEKDEDLEKIRSDADDEAARLADEKEKLVTDVVDDDSLAKLIADEIGADHVVTSDE